MLRLVEVRRRNCQDSDARAETLAIVAVAAQFLLPSGTMHTVTVAPKSLGLPIRQPGKRPDSTMNTRSKSMRRFAFFVRLYR